MDLRRRLSPTFISAARSRWRPGLRTVVVAPAVAIVVAMAVVVSNGVADELRRIATDSAVHSVEAIVRGYVDPVLDASSLDLDAPRDPAIDAQLERLTVSGEIRRIDLWSRDGRIVYSNVPELRGRRLSIGPLLAAAYAGESVAHYATARDDGASRSPASGPTETLEHDGPTNAAVSLPARCGPMARSRRSTQTTAGASVTERVAERVATLADDARVRAYEILGDRPRAVEIMERRLLGV